MIDLDVRSFFDKLSHDWLLQFVEHRIGGGDLTDPGQSLPALCASISGTDAWREKVARGDVIVVRYADDLCWEIGRASGRERV